MRLWRSLTVTTLAAVLGTATMLSHPVPALADGSCWPFSSAYGPCVYSPAYPQAPGDFVRINVSIDPVTIPSSSSIYRDILAAIDDWNASGAFVRLTLSGGQYNNLLIWGTTSPPHGGNWNSDCNTTAWGQSWNGNGGDTMYHQVALNIYAFHCTPDGDWTGVIVHEMGHAMGLAHNDYRSFNGAQGLGYRMNTNVMHVWGWPCDPAFGNGSSGKCPYVHPSPEDQWLINQLYPSVPVRCNASPSNDSCNGMDYVQQGCSARGILRNPMGTPWGYLQLYYSDSCQSNWASATANYGWQIYRLSVNRASGPDGGALTSEDLVAAVSTPGSPIRSWYGNMLYSPNNHDAACVSYINDAGTQITPFTCTNFY